MKVQSQSGHRRSQTLVDGETLSNRYRETAMLLADAIDGLQLLVRTTKETKYAIPITMSDPRLIH